MQGRDYDSKICPPVIAFWSYALDTVCHTLLLAQDCASGQDFPFKIKMHNRRLFHTSKRKFGNKYSLPENKILFRVYHFILCYFHMHCCKFCVRFELCYIVNRGTWKYKSFCLFPLKLIAIIEGWVWKETEHVKMLMEGYKFKKICDFTYIAVGKLEWFPALFSPLCPRQ